MEYNVILDGVDFYVKCDWDNDDLDGFVIEEVFVDGGTSDILDFLSDRVVERLTADALEIVRGE